VNGIAFIPAPTTEYRGIRGEPLTLADFAVGEKVKAKGRVGSGGAILEKLEKK